MKALVQMQFVFLRHSLMIMTKIYTLPLLFILFSHFGFSQDYTFQIEINQTKIEKKALYYSQEDSITFSGCKFYVSNLLCLNETGKIIYENKTTQLIDVFDDNTLSVPADIISKTHTINFEVGCDTTLTSMPPISGDLSAQNGMFWTWTEGYMAIKMEGTHQNSPELKHQFVLHLGNGKESSRALAVIETNGKSNLSINLTEIIKEHSFAAFPTIMEQGEETTILIQQFASSIHAW